MSYYQKYLKYKHKYIELKNIVGGNAAGSSNKPKEIPKEPYSIFRDIVQNIVDLSAEADCCLGEVNKVTSSTKIQQKYIDILQKNFKEFYIQLNSTINKITKTDKKNSGIFLKEKILSVNIDNMINTLDIYFWPIITSTINNYISALKNIKEQIKQNNLPKFTISQKYKRTTSVCIDVDPNSKTEQVCCSVGIGTESCFWLIGGKKLINFSLRLKDLLSFVEKSDISLSQKNKITYDLKNKLDTLLSKNKEINNNMPDEAINDNIRNKIKSDEIAKLTVGIDKKVDAKFKTMYGNLEIDKK